MKIKKIMLQKWIFQKMGNLFIVQIDRGYDKMVLSVVDCVSIYGKTPRHFSITSDNKWLIGANQDSNNSVVFKRNLIIIVYLLYIIH